MKPFLFQYKPDNSEPDYNYVFEFIVNINNLNTEEHTVILEQK